MLSKRRKEEEDQRLNSGTIRVIHPPNAVQSLYPLHNAKITFQPAYPRNKDPISLPNRSLDRH